jgi:hypothetical protein
MSTNTVCPGSIAIVHMIWLDAQVHLFGPFGPATPETVVPGGKVKVNEEIGSVPVFSMASLVAYPSTPHWAQSEMSPVVPHTVSPNAVDPTASPTPVPAASASSITP